MDWKVGKEGQQPDKETREGIAVLCSMYEAIKGMMESCMNSYLGGALEG